MHTTGKYGVLVLKASSITGSTVAEIMMLMIIMMIMMVQSLIVLFYLSTKRAWIHD